MRLGLIGDVHAEDALLERTLDEMREMRVDQILCTGDLVDGLGSVDRVIQLLRRHDVLTVRGNHDRWIREDDLRTLPHAHKMTDLAIESIAYLKELPKTRALDVPSGGKLLLCHGVGENDMCKLGPDDHGYAISSNEDLLKLLFDLHVHVMVGGHTHTPMLRRFERARGKEALWVINPGTLCREDKPGFAVANLERRRVDFHRFETPSAKSVLATTRVMG